MSFSEKALIALILVGLFATWHSIGFLKVLWNSRKTKTPHGRRYGR